MTAPVTPPRAARRLDGVRPVLPGAAALLAAAAVLRWREHLRLPAVLSIAAVLLVAVTAVWPGIGRFVSGRADSLGHLVGRALSVAVLGVAWLLVVIPVSLLNRALAIDLLSGGGAWDPRRRRGPGAARRGYGAEVAAPVGRPRRAARAAVPFVAVALVAVPVYHRVTEDRPRPGDLFGPRASEPPSGEVAVDDWARVWPDVRVSQTSFPGEPWGAELLREQYTGLQQGDDRLGLVNRDHHGRYDNVVEGRRVTLEEPDPEATVWLFGGSTVYGVGQRDEHTIASDLVRVARRDGHRVRVVNFGVSAYVNWQETQVFLEALATGPPPDLAVFLDGANDLAVAWEREKYGLLDASRPETLTFSDELREQREAYARAVGWDESHDLERQVQLTAQQYGAGARLARNAARRRRVPVLFFWQPSLRTMPADAPGNATVYNNLGVDSEATPEYEEVADEAAVRSGVDPIDLTDVFDHADRPVFFDWAHSNEYGARVQADAMWGPIEAALFGGAPAAGEPR